MKIECPAFEQYQDLSGSVVLARFPAPGLSGFPGKIMKQVFVLLCAWLFLSSSILPDVAFAREAGKPDEAGADLVDFRFDQVEIRFLVKIVGELTGRRFVVDDKIQGKITIVSQGKIPVSDIYPMFVSILDSSGYSVIEQDGISRIVPRGDRPTPVVPVYGSDDALPDTGVLTRIISVKHVRASDLRNLLAPMVEGAESSLGVLESANYLVVTDTAESIRRVERIIAEIDKPDMVRVTEIVPVKHASAEDIAHELNTAIAGTAAMRQPTRGERLQQRLQHQSPPGTSAMPTDALVVAAPHSNSLILVGTQSQIMDLKQIIKQMDVQPVSGHGRIRAIFLQYLSSEEAAASLNSLLAKTAESPVRQRIAIEPSIANNALVVDAAPQDFEAVRELIEQLDKSPHQVMVEVMIAELTMEDGSDIGVEMFAGGSPSEGSTIAMGGSRMEDGKGTLVNDIVQGMIPHGLTFGLTKGSYTDASGNVVPRIPALVNIQALRKHSKFNVLSNIPLWAQNNQQASVSIVENIPILTSTISGGSGTARDVIQNIERVDVGIKLTLTPQVNPNNEIRMTLNPSIEAVLDRGASELTPRIARREVSTTVTVPNGETIVISGLMRQDDVERERRVPVLGSIPLIGYFFRSSHKAKTKTNLLIFVTPHIVGVTSDALALQKMLKEKKLENPWAEPESLETAPGHDAGTPAISDKPVFNDAP